MKKFFNIQQNNIKMKGYSIITDFGCITNCSYCIWKKHKLNNKKYNKSSFINKISTFLDNCNKVSISGGGDPLNNPDDNMDFWNTLIDHCSYKNIKIDIHTSYINHTDIINKIFENKSLINRIVIHSSLNRFYKQFDNIENYKYRFNFVVTNELNIPELEKIENILKQNDIQLAYRELVSDNYKIYPNIDDFCKSVSFRYDLGRYVKQDDYNLYLMPNGQITDKFLF